MVEKIVCELVRREVTVGSRRCQAGRQGGRSYLRPSRARSRQTTSRCQMAHTRQDSVSRAQNSFVGCAQLGVHTLVCTIWCAKVGRTIGKWRMHKYWHSQGDTSAAPQNGLYLQDVTDKFRHKQKANLITVEGCVDTYCVLWS